MSVTTNPIVTNVNLTGVVTNSYGGVTNVPFVLPSDGQVAHYDASNSDSVKIGAGVSRWVDLSGNGNDLVQAVGANQPAYAANAVTFDGAAHFLKTATFTLNQPETVYLVMQQPTWTLNESMMDGFAIGSGILRQRQVTPNIAVFAGAWAAENSDLAVGTVDAIVYVINGASSSIKVGSNAATTGDAGAANMSGFTLGARADGGSLANIAVNEAAIYNVAHDAATQALIIAGLKAKWEA